MVLLYLSKSNSGALEMAGYEKNFFIAASEKIAWSPQFISRTLGFEGTGYTVLYPPVFPSNNFVVSCAALQFPR